MRRKEESKSCVALRHLRFRFGLNEANYCARVQPDPRHRHLNTSEYLGSRLLIPCGLVIFSKSYAPVFILLGNGECGMHLGAVRRRVWGLASEFCSPVPARLQRKFCRTFT
jgi:hypothetical protein